MKIRAITAFTTIQADAFHDSIAKAGQFLAEAASAFKKDGIDVQSRRLATQPFPQYGLSSPGQVAALAVKLHDECTANGIDYLSLGPASAADDPACIDVIAEVVRSAPNVFAAVEIAHAKHGIDLDILRRVVRLIQALSRVSGDGMGNLFFAALANCPPGSPFFPAAYHGSGPLRFALAIEGADLALAAFNGADSPVEARVRLIEQVEKAAARLVKIAGALAMRFDVPFGGLDFSLAPYPGQATSLAGAMEKLGATAGGGGMVAGAALVMNALEQAAFPRCGFSGLMLPILEDTVLGQRAAEGVLSVNDLLLYSAVCGTGLDCIPLPGDVEVEPLAGMLLDVGALALRLNKPLTARLMPLPGKVAGDVTEFSFEYFVPSRVIAPPAGLSAGAFQAHGTLAVSPRPQA